MSERVFLGIGSNLASPERNVRAAIGHIRSFANVLAVSRLYRTAPWGVADQPDYCNAAVLLETELTPSELLRECKALEVRMGRTPSVRWGPRLIDVDILLFGDQTVDEPNLTIPHPRLYERAFVLTPLADLDPRFAEFSARLSVQERESVSLMSEDALAGRVRTLAQAFLQTDLMRLRIEDENDDAIELRRKSVAAPRRITAAAAAEADSPPPPRPDAIKADLVGVFHFSRPAVAEGDILDEERELGYVEALGIRNPVRSLGRGQIVAVHCKDGDPVDYGHVLFEIARV